MPLMLCRRLRGRRGHGKEIVSASSADEREHFGDCSNRVHQLPCIVGAAGQCLNDFTWYSKTFRLCSSSVVAKACEPSLRLTK